MDISIFLAQAFGLYFVIGGLAMFLHPYIVKDMIAMWCSNRTAMFLGGFVALLVGIPLVLVHNIWDGTWHTGISVLAWLTFLKGITLVFAPDAAARWALTLETKKSTLKTLLAFMIFFGLYLIYIGFNLGAR